MQRFLNSAFITTSLILIIIGLEVGSVYFSNSFFMYFFASTTEKIIIVRALLGTTLIGLLIKRELRSLIISLGIGLLGIALSMFAIRQLLYSQMHIFDGLMYLGVGTVYGLFALEGQKATHKLPAIKMPSFSVPSLIFTIHRLITQTTKRTVAQ